MTYPPNGRVHCWAPVFEIEITDPTKPIWYYCAQKGHCAKGMVGSINANETGTGNTLEQFRSTAQGTTDANVLIPTDNTVRGGTFINMGSGDILVLGTSSSSSSSNSISTLIIQVNVAIITVNNGQTSTIGTTTLTYPPGSVPSSGQQVMYIMPVTSSGSSTSYTPSWAIPPSGAPALSTSTVAGSSSISSSATNLSSATGVSSRANALAFAADRMVVLAGGMVLGALALV